MKEIKGKSVLILGYGREGKSVHKYLLENYPKLKIGIADKEKPEDLLNQKIELYTGPKYLDSVSLFDTVVRSPGIPATAPQLVKAKKQGIHITTATNIFFSQCKGKIIGITGTKGKSTTSSLIYEILRQKYPDVRLLGNIGKPALDYLENQNKNTIFVMELSSQQLDDVRYSPHIAVILEVLSEHLDYHKSVSRYRKAKANIVYFQKENDFVVFNPRHKSTASIVKKSRGREICFTNSGAGEGFCFVKNGTIYCKIKEGEIPIVKIGEIPLLGPGNIENTQAAICVGMLLRVPLEKIRAGVKQFRPLSHRLEFVAEVKSIRFYNDSIATIPHATIHALKALGDDVQTIILGGYRRPGIDFSDLAEYLKKTKVENVILFPTTGRLIWREIKKAFFDKKLPKKYEVNSMQEAVDIAFSNTQKGKICLLSPASASFGLFRNFEERGNLFKKFVLEKEKSLH